ncbi:hypothetical protein [Aneurinibacillus aneurinilyticus]|uniref:hypothetical protein n=1 Tax=Aneurinibacillus aneurinilyticus TaxID=1391 RepID=UPI0023F99BF5|nr:hypothetical protein [Aneurinibacillus aneurinilyticus]MCI1696805.1 hypothetical protein [Aneurinibacillus aneurinilyticus]
MISLNDFFQKEFEKMQSLDGIKQQFISNNESAIKKIFGYIFSINYLKNKVETRRYFSSEFNMTFSLLLESIYALFTGQCRSALLLLRSAQEANYKFVLEREREFMLVKNSSISFEPLDYRFIETKKKFISDLQNCLDKTDFKEYYISVERNLTLYKRLSGIVHSGSKSLPVMSVEYFSKLHEETIVDSKEFFNLFCSVLNEIFLLNFFLIRESLSKWDYYAVYNLLRIIYGDKRSKTLIGIVKKS